MKIMTVSTAILAAAIGIGIGATTNAADKKNDGKMSLADERFEMTVPGKWERKQPSNNIIEYEYEVPASTGDARPGRMTMMGAGGSIEDNINRWYGQFRQPDGSETSNTAKTEQKKVAGQEVTVVDVSGTYLDKPGGPFAGNKTIEREDYRMLAAIVETTKKGKKTGNYFIKLIGPKQTIADNKEAFEKMIESLKERP